MIQWFLPMPVPDRRKMMAAMGASSGVAMRRHRRITIWHQSGVPAREFAERAGHARPSMSLDAHPLVMPPDELAPERFMALVRGEVG